MEYSEALAAKVERPSRPSELAAALRAYQQGDMDGVMVLVSRQACDEGADWLERLSRRVSSTSRPRYFARQSLKQQSNQSC